uniref:Nuclear pore complex protein Nup85 n=1 Tax=Rhodnius prolixus TaxID=13249 RepID=T1HCQ5_RHOPR
MSHFVLPQTTFVKDEVCQKVGVTFSWAQANELAVYGFCEKQGREQSGTSLLRREINGGKIYFYKHAELLDDPELRKLINESNTTFISSRNVPITVQSSRNRILELSPDTVLPKLLEWTRMDRADLDELASEIVTSSLTKGADLRHPEYWEVVMGLLLIGRFDSTRALLKLHSEADTVPFFEADLLLRSIPVYTLIGSDQPSFDLFKPYCATWYQMMVSMLLFTDPIVKIHDLNYHANQCIEYFGGRSKLKLLDHTILALVDSNLNLAIKYLLYTADGGWCAVHLTNLLDLAGNLNKNSRGDHIDFEQMLLDYGEMLMSHQSYWQVGLTYLEQCKVHGWDAMKVLMLKLPLTSEEKALKIIAKAKEYNVTDVVNDICKVMATSRLRNGNLSGALTWSLMSNDAQYTDYIADKYLRSYAMGCSDSEIGCSQALMNLGQSVLISSRLTFLAKYCEFHSLYEEDKKKEAASLLIRLIDSKVSPKYFWFTLLLDALPLLLNEHPLLSHDDTTIILACLEELATDTADNPIRSTPKFNENTTLLRKEITKNLARSLLIESSNTTNEKIIKCV